MDRIHSQSPKREVKKKKKSTQGSLPSFREETRGRGEREGGERGRGGRVREKSEENGDGGGQMARDERERGVVKEGER